MCGGELFYGKHYRELCCEQPAGDSDCLFTISFDKDGNGITRWTIEVVRDNVNYFALMRLMDKIEKRTKRVQRLASGFIDKSANQLKQNNSGE